MKLLGALLVALLLLAAFIIANVWAVGAVWLYRLIAAIGFAWLYHVAWRNSWPHWAQFIAVAIASILGGWWLADGVLLLGFGSGVSYTLLMAACIALAWAVITLPSAGAFRRFMRFVVRA